MACLRTALALVLTWTLAVSAQGWKPVATRIRGLRRLLPDANETPTFGSYKTEEEWGLINPVSSLDKSDDYTDGYAVAEVGDPSTNLALYSNHGFQVEYMDVTGPRPAPRAPQPSCGPPTTSIPTTVPGTLPTPPPQPPNTLTENPKPSGCSIHKEQHIRCGSHGISSDDCEEKGCCVDPTTSSCFYAMDDCTKDKQFVFAIYKDSTTVPVDPTKLVIPGSNCVPVIVNADFAIYIFSVGDCGTRSYEIGDTLIYLIEVQTPVNVRNLKYGVITRDDPLRFLVECRYSKKDASSKQSLISIGFMVKTPIMSFPSTITSDGLFAIELRIAKDETYSDYYPHDHSPLHLLLRKPVYLEVHLKSPKPFAALKVNYCLAYPLSAKNALVLVYEGCANPLDPNVSILQVSDLPSNRHERRFVVNAFQFMETKTNKYLDEEIYFMCSVELCMPLEKTCEESCFDGKL